MSEPEKQEILRFPNLIVFISSFCLMVLELVAGRLMAPYLGVSLLGKITEEGKYNDLEKVGFLVSEERTEKFLEEKVAIVLTDDYVPTDNLLAPVFNYAY